MNNKIDSQYNEVKKNSENRVNNGLTTQSWQSDQIDLGVPHSFVGGRPGEEMFDRGGINWL